MFKSHRKILLVVLVLGLVFVLALVHSSGTPNSNLTVTYLTRTNDSGQWIAQFAITNVGDAAAISFPGGQIEMFGQAQKVPVGCRTKRHRLLPGEGDIVQVVLPQGFQGRWRFTCLYAREGIRSRIYDWQWGVGGPGPRVNRFIPSFLKGVRLDVSATSDWIDEPEPASSLDKSNVIGGWLRR